MKPEYKKRIRKIAEMAWKLFRCFCSVVVRCAERFAHFCANRIRAFCESRKTIEDLKFANAQLNAQLEVAREKAQSTNEEIQRLRSQLDDARGEAESAYDDVNQILSELKRRAQGLAAKLNHNIMHSGSPTGVVIDQTVKQWYRDFKEWWNNKGEDNDDEDKEDEEDEEDEEEEDNGEEDDEDEYDSSDDNGDNEEANDSGDYGDDGPEHDYDPSRSGSDIDQSFLETANDLFERLDELPKKCNRFTIRFVAANSNNWIQPEKWHLDDDDGSLIFGLYDDEENYEAFTVADLKNILTGGSEDDDGNTGIEEDTPIYIDDPDSDDYFRLLDEYFKIRWKQRRVEIPMIEDCGNDEDDEDDDDSESDDNDEEDEYDEDEDENEYDDDDEDESDDEDDEYYEDENDENNEDDGDDEDDEDEYDEDYENDEDDEDEKENEDDGDNSDGGDDFAQRAASSLVLGIIMENGRRRHNDY